MEVILASASPRRRELLSSVGLEYKVVPADIIEAEYTQGSPAAYARALAQAKAQAVAYEYPEAIVIGADTIVLCEEQILGKPEDEADAKRMLRFLSGRRHDVITGVAVAAGCGPCAGQTLLSHVQSGVYFRELTDDEIDAYVAGGEPLDKAGAYGIQGVAALFIERIDGCYFNIVGLPLYKVGAMLNQCGVALLTRRHALAGSR
ncbi:MAG TPA: septum formation inhibitor Maf [Firmicutes bacterium]|jgi:septum formation protein|nr:septum formation inhibitor Maf [Bacillota bacterium]